MKQIYTINIANYKLRTTRGTAGSVPFKYHIDYLKSVRMTKQTRKAERE